MNKNRQLVYICIIAWMIISLSCSLPSLPFLSSTEENQKNYTPIPSSTEENQKNYIPIPSEQPTTLGGMEGDLASVFIPPGSFGENASAEMNNPTSLPAEPEQGWSGLGKPIQVNLEAGQTRSDQPIQVTILFDPAGIVEEGEVFVGYYHDLYGWYYFAPDSVDLEYGTLTFTTYHFSDFAGMKADEVKRIDQFLEESAVETFVKQTTQEQSREEIEAMVEKIMKQGAGVYDTHTIEIVTKAVVNAIPGGRIAAALGEATSDAIAKATVEVTMDEFGKLLSKDKKLLQEIRDDNPVGAFSTASGYFAEGEYQEAAKVMGDEIINNTPVIGNVKKAAEGIVELADDVITNAWLKPEMRKAFQVYKNGGEGGLFGYNVDAGNWPELLSQMRGVFAKVRSDYVASHCKLRGIDPDRLSSEEKNQIADMGMERLRTQFDERIARRAEIDEIKANQQGLIEAFAEKQLLIRDSVNPMYSGDEDLETLMNRLLNITQRIIQDTGRNEIIFHSFDEDIDRPGTQIYGQQVAELAHIWYNTRKKHGPERAEEVYKEALIEMGLAEVVEGDENLIYGVKPQKVTCEGQYTVTTTNIDAPEYTCTFNKPFSVEFWNVGVLGGAEFAGATLYRSSTTINWDDCGIISLQERSSSAQYSGGPNGSMTIDGANIQISSGQTGILNFSDSENTVSGTCTINNPSAFAGWNGP